MKLIEKVLRRVFKTVSRRGLRMAFFLSDETKRRGERWLRGKEEFRRLQGCDFAVVSHPKSGRTWLRVMFSRYFQLRYGIPEGYMLGYDNFNDMESRCPRVFFTHDNYLRSYTGDGDSKAAFAAKKVVLLARKPQDVAASSFFQWKHRTKPHKKTLNQTPSHGSDISMYEFAMEPSIGLPHIVDFLNEWSSGSSQIPEILVVRYEEMRAHPEREFGRIIEFVDSPADATQVKGAVEFATLENTRKMETQDHFWKSGSRLAPADKDNPDSYKSRRAKVGGYRDYFEDGELRTIDAYVREKLQPGFGYDEEPAGSD